MICNLTLSGCVQRCITPPVIKQASRQEVGLLVTEQTTITYTKPTIADAANCTIVREGVQKKARRPPTHELGLATEVTFEMIGTRFNRHI